MRLTDLVVIQTRCLYTYVRLDIWTFVWTHETHDNPPTESLSRVSPRVSGTVFRCLFYYHSKISVVQSNRSCVLKNSEHTLNPTQYRVPVLSYGDDPPNHCQSHRADDPLPICYPPLWGGGNKWPVRLHPTPVPSRWTYLCKIHLLCSNDGFFVYYKR